MILKDKKFLFTGILTDKSIAYASAKIAIENGATVVATGFGKGLRITERAVKRLSDDIKVYSMDIEDQSEVDEAVKSIEKDVGYIPRAILEGDLYPETFGALVSAYETDIT